MRITTSITVSLTILWATLLPGATISDSFEMSDHGLTWSIPLGTSQTVDASEEIRLQGIAHPVSGERVRRLATDGDTSGVHLALTGGPAQDMAAQAWVFCDGNDGATGVGGYQALVVRTSQAGNTNMIRLAWDPNHSETGQTGDGWVKLQAYDGTTWDYLGIDFSQFGSATNGYILDGTDWSSGWHLFRLEVTGDQVSAFVDDMDTPVATGTLSVTLRDGGAGFYVHTDGDIAGHFDNFSAEIVAPPPTDFDLLILNGEVYQDGDTASQMIDIGIIDNRIASMEEDLSSFTARQTIDASGLLVVPGFIDAHTHADGGGALIAHLRQGVTTVVAGNCGGSPNPTTLDSLLSSMTGTLGPNYLTLIGHNAIRGMAGLSGSDPTPAQIQTMQNLIAAWMEAGAFGLSTGLIYATGFNSSTEEIIALAETVAEHGGLYATHMRDESGGVLDSVREAIRIGTEAGCPVQISHAKCAGPSAWGLSDEFVALIQQAHDDGLQIFIDQYPYTASQTTINALIPDWAETSWSDAVANHREDLEAGIRDLIAGRGGADRVFFISGPFDNQWLSEVATNLGKDPEDVIIDDVGLNGANAIYHTMIEDDVQVLMGSTLNMVGSDSPAGSHPRGSGTFPRFWGHYGRDLGMFTPQELVRRTSTMAARQFRLDEQQRGELWPGWFADIAIIDWNAIDSPATFEQPTLAPTGVKWVIVNGTVASQDGTIQDSTSGRALRLTDSVAPMTGLLLR